MAASPRRGARAAAMGGAPRDFIFYYSTEVLCGQWAATGRMEPEEWWSAAESHWRY